MEASRFSTTAKRRSAIKLGPGHDQTGCLRRSNAAKSSSNYSNSASDSTKSKKARLSFSQSRRSKGLPPSNEFKLSSNHLEEKLTGVKVSTGRNGICLWTEKYKPDSLGDLAVHRKKVEQVKTWFESKFIKGQDQSGSNVILLTGSAGIGKSATIQVIANELGAQLFEWKTPTPTLWKEHIHHNGSGPAYASKTEEFEVFVERMRKYGSPFSRRPVILCIDDLPFADMTDTNRAIESCLRRLVRYSPVPTAVLITDPSPAQALLVSLLEASGACKVSFNPVTVSSTKKTLSRICREEGCPVPPEVVDALARSSAGDIRSAVTSLQYMTLSNHETPTAVRDPTLSLYHALAKFLHNKRGEVSSSDDGGGGEGSFPVREMFRRPPLPVPSPETILDRSSAPARHVLDFLHENFLDFVGDEGADDVAAGLSYLSSADLLGRHSDARREVGAAAAASVAARGVLFANVHPAPPTWHSIRRPRLWHVDRRASAAVLRTSFPTWAGEWQLRDTAADAAISEGDEIEDC